MSLSLFAGECSFVVLLNTCDLYLHCGLLLRDRNSSVHMLLVQESEIWQDRKNDHQSMKLCKHNNNSGHFYSAVSH